MNQFRIITRGAVVLLIASSFMPLGAQDKAAESAAQRNKTTSTNPQPKGITPDAAIGQLGLPDAKKAEILKMIEELPQKQADASRANNGKTKALREKADELLKSGDKQGALKTKVEMMHHTMGYKAGPIDVRDREIARMLTLEQYIEYRQLVHPGKPMTLEAFSDEQIDAMAKYLKVLARKLPAIKPASTDWTFEVVSALDAITRQLSMEEALGLFDLGGKFSPPVGDFAGLSEETCEMFTWVVKTSGEELAAADTSDKRRAVLAARWPTLMTTLSPAQRSALAREAVVDR